MVIIGGCVILEQFATTHQCADLIAEVTDYRNQHIVPVIERPSEELPLKYAVIDGERIEASLPKVSKIYERVTRLVKKLWPGKIEPLQDRKVACNINITEPGGSYRYHYDRNAVTALLYLNEIDGGETECYPNYRLTLPHARSSTLQQRLDCLLQKPWVRSLAGKQLLVRPRVGRLLIMQGNRCLHSVWPVRGRTDRINIVMSYDRPEARFEVAENLNNYLYSAAEVPVSDPNYLM